MLLFFAVVLATTALAVFFHPESVREDQTLLPYVLVTGTMAALFVAQLAWLKNRQSKGVTLLHPPIFLTAWSLFMICLPGLASFFDPDLLTELEAGVAISYGFATEGMLLLLAGLLVMWLGYLAGLRMTRPVEWLRRFSLSDISAGPLIALYGATVVVRAVRIAVAGFAFGVDRSQLGEFAAFDQWLGYLDDSRYLVIAIWALKVFRREWRPLPFIAIAMIELAYAFTSGFMKPLLWLIMIVLMLAVYAGVRLRQHVPLFVAGVLFALLIVPVAEGIRKEYSGLGSAGFDAHSGADILASTVAGFQNSWGQGFGVGWDIFEKKMLGREAMVAHMPGIIVALTPNAFPYQGFVKLFTDLPASVIPRAIWHDKPELSRGVWFSHTYLNIPESIQTSSAPTIVGETYWYHGWSATLTAMVLLGLFLAVLYQNTVGVGLIPLYVSLLPNLDIEGQFTVMVLTLTERFFIGLFTLWALITVSRQLSSRQPAYEGDYDSSDVEEPEVAAHMLEFSSPDVTEH